MEGVQCSSTGIFLWCTEFLVFTKITQGYMCPTSPAISHRTALQVQIVMFCCYTGVALGAVPILAGLKVHIGFRPIDTPSAH